MRTTTGAATVKDARPAVAAGVFHAAPWLDDPSTLPVVGELLEPVSPGPVRTALGEPYVQPYDNVYLRYAGADRPAVGDRLLLVRVGRRIGERGRVIQPTAIATVAALHADVMTAGVAELFGVTVPGALALPLERPPQAPDRTEPVESGPTGTLIAFVTEQPLHGTTDHGFVDLGRAAGLEPGDELVALLPERPATAVDGVRLPPEPVARLQVVRVTEQTATVRVVQAMQPTLHAGLPVQLIRKVP